MISTKKLMNFARLNPGPPCADARASWTPNQTSMMVANAMTIRKPERVDRRGYSRSEVVTSVLNQYQKIHCRPPNLSIVKTPLSSGIRLLGHHVVEFLLITVARLKQRLQVVLLNLLANYQLKGLSLKDLVCLLLNPQFDKEGLVDPLERRHFRMPRRIGRMSCRFELADISFASCGIRANCPHGL